MRQGDFMFKTAVAIFSIICMTGCLVPVAMPSMSIRTTGFATSNVLVVVCPPQHTMRVERITPWGRESFSVQEGGSVAIPGAGIFGDAPFVVVAYGYRNSRLVGTQTLEVRFYGNDPQTRVWSPSF